MSTPTFTAAVTHEAPLYVARCLEVEVASQGASVDAALASLKEALELYFEDVSLPEGMEPPLIAKVELSEEVRISAIRSEFVPPTGFGKHW
ncbi:MAG: type II toxin-antitoxin system HicB family antitoxin [Actinobacteria bacterium]|nr:type II toxin-antitoxin system HicB family antitoxin [Actinomycetota bacterium]